LTNYLMVDGTMRKPTDICLLCRTNSATQKRSHILPKFLSKNLFGHKTVKRGFEISSTHTLGKSPKIVQDSPKEDYILCPDCEMYFSILESISRDTFINWKSKISSDNFTQKTLSSFLSIVYYASENKAAIRLFIYSIYWRTSISSHPLFQNINLVKDIEEELRQSLISYKATKQSDFLTNANSTNLIKLFPIAIITADSFKSETSNVLFVPFFNNVYRLIVDKFSFLLFKNLNEIPVDFFKSNSNFEINDCRIIVLSEKLWLNTILKPVFDLIAEEVVKNGQKK
jgi:hypothetical protein